MSLHASDPPNPWAGYEQALRRALEGQNTHIVLLQDDATPCRDFSRAVADRVTERPENVISLWVGALRGKTLVNYRKAMIAKQRWCPIYFSDIHHCVALVWPRGLAKSFLEWTETSRLPGEDRPAQSDDAIVGAWARRTGTQIWATVPCLVEHEDQVESIIGRRRGDAGRRAIWFSGS